MQPEQSSAASHLDAFLRRQFIWFHQHPEVAWQEHQTTAHIKHCLAEMGLPLLELGLDTGAAALIKGTAVPPSGTSSPASCKPVVALRADIDALPIQEGTDLPYASQNPGCMHACGHDFHLTALLGAALLLQQQASSLCGDIKLVFQPAEEGAKGSDAVLASGILDDVQEIYGLHNDPFLPPGTLAVAPGATYATVDRFSIHIQGAGGHAATPHKTADPIVAAALLTEQLQTIVSRNTNPFTQAILSITQLHAGSTWNVIPHSAQLEGTVRTLDPDAQALIQTRMRQICAGVGQASGTTIHLDIQEITPATQNDGALCDFVLQTATALKIPTAPFVPALLGEDFAVYQRKIPGVFFNFGVGASLPLHSPHFVANQQALAPAATFLSGLAQAALLRLCMTS